MTTTVPVQPAGAASLLDGMPAPAAATASDDLLAGMPAATAPGVFGRVVGEAERGMVGGATGLASTAQAAGRWLDNHTAGFLPGLATPAADNVDIQGIAGRALDRDNAYQPAGTSGKLVEGAVSGLTGAALTGGLGAAPEALAAGASQLAQRLAPATFAAVSGAVPAGAKALGATDNEADLAGLAAGFGGVGAAMAGRAAAGAARGAVARSLYPGMTADEAQQALRYGQLQQGYMAAGAPTASAASSSLKADLAGGLDAFSAAAKRAGLVNQSGKNTLDTIAAQAGNHRSALTGADGSAYGQLSATGLPVGYQDAYGDAATTLDHFSGDQFAGSAVGPFGLMARKATPLIGAAGAAALASHGELVPAAGAALGALGGLTGPGAAIAQKTGGLLDKVTGLALTPLQAKALRAQQVLKQAGIDPATVDDTNPLTTLQGLTAGLNKQADVAAGWKANAATTAATDTTWNRALIQQARQASGALSPVDDDALWQSAEAQPAPNLSAVTRSQVAGFNADQAAQATAQRQQRAYEVADATAMDRQRTSAMATQAAQQARGLNLSEGAGAWLERQQIQAAKQANPGVPITGAAALGARGPQEVFDATGGRYGSPADPDEAALFADAGSQVGAPAQAATGAPTGRLTASPTGPLQGAPVGLPQGAATVPSASLYGPPAATSAPSLGQLPSGGMALAQTMAAERFPGQPMPTPDELHSAIDDLSADGLIAPQMADHLHAGGVTPDRHLAGNILDRVMTGRGLPSILDNRQAAMAEAQGQFSIAGQAQSEVADLMGGGLVGPTTGAPPVPSVGLPGQPVPASMTRLPAVRDPVRYQATVSSRQIHAQNMAALTSDPETKIAISRIAAEPTTAGKAAIRDVWMASHPDSPDTKLFTPQLLSGS